MKFIARSVLSIFLLFSGSALAGNMIRVQALGSSPKGQYVAFEEFGYMDGLKAPFSQIRVKNVWKDRYVDQPIKVVDEGKEEKQEDEMALEQVRAKAKSLAREKLKTYNIST